MTKASEYQGNTYKTKLATGESFTVHKVDTNHKGEVIRFWGVYSGSPLLTNCPISPDRLILI